MCVQKIAYFCIILAIFPNVIICAPDKNSAVKSISMYEVIVEKCPYIEKIDLKKILNDSFDSKCTDWEAIDKLTVLADGDKTNAQCLLLYESIIPFCTQIGEKIVLLGDVIKSLIKDQDTTLDTICFEKGLSKMKNTAHNLTNLLQPPSVCNFICEGKLKNGKPAPEDICKIAYFFSAFNMTKLLSHFNNHQDNEVPQSPSKGNILLAESVPRLHPGSTDIKNVSKEEEKTKQENQPPIPNVKKESDLEEKKPLSDNVHKHVDVDKDDSKIGPDKIQPPKANKVIDKDFKVVEPNVDNAAAAGAQEAETQNQPPKTEQSETVKKDEKPGAGESKNALKDEKSEVNLDSGQDTNGDGKDADDADQKEALMHGDNDAKDDFTEENEKDYADESGNEKDIDVLKNGLPDETILETKPAAKKGKPSTLDEEPVSSYNLPEGDMDGDSYFFSYFSVFMCLVIVGYVAYHNRQKVLALLLEGKRGKRGSRTSRRPNSANYHKLDSNLEEAISSSCTKNSSNVIY